MFKGFLENFKHIMSIIIRYVLFFLLSACVSFSIFALDFMELTSLNDMKPTNQQSILTPTPPDISAKAYLLVDADSGKIIAAKNETQHYEPASLTKVMAMYVIFDAIQKGYLNLEQNVRISKNAWKTGGSRMFIKAGQRVSVRDLIQGVIVQSGNDATISLAEHIAGSESAFVNLMNQHARLMGMQETHFVTSTGMPHPDHYTTAKDMAILARKTIQDHKTHYTWYKQKWFTFNGIKQPNRNRLLWLDDTIDGIKTGHTKSAGYCLAVSSEKKGMRLIAIILGAHSDKSRSNDGQHLMNYGFRFFETHAVHRKDQTQLKRTVWFAKQKKLTLGLSSDVIVTIPLGADKQLTTEWALPKIITAPIHKGEKLGTLTIKLNHKVIKAVPLIAKETIEPAGRLGTFSDKTKLMLYRWFKLDPQRA